MPFPPGSQPRPLPTAKALSKARWESAFSLFLLNAVSSSNNNNNDNNDNNNNNNNYYYYYKYFIYTAKK